LLRSSTSFSLLRINPKLRPEPLQSVVNESISSTRSLSKIAVDNWVACPEQPCPNRYVQGIDADPDSWFEEFRAPNHEQVAQIQERQRQNAQLFPVSNPSVSIAPRSPSPPSRQPSPFLQTAAVISLRPVRTALSAVVGEFFWDLLSRPSTRAPVTMSGHQTPAPGSSAAPVVNISAQDLMNLMGSMATSISALTASVQALVNA
jgi:hypothetical protein